MESDSAFTFDQIRQRAYELWERNHQPMGFEIEFWLMAEQELRTERRSAGSNEARSLRGTPVTQTPGNTPRRS